MRGLRVAARRAFGSADRGDGKKKQKGLTWTVAECAKGAVAAAAPGGVAEAVFGVGGGGGGTRLRS